ncbi:MAG: Rrf2 family transcriptional regulator, partial [Clostridia bacterium]|nr:Rrf2 family transcriptional regulator [Clostridia bacterium]
GELMKLSSKTHYGLIACHILGKNYPDNQVSASTLEAHISVSGKNLEKIMRMLSARGIVAASRGVSGGYFLARAPKDISIGEIVRALEDDMEII